MFSLPAVNSCDQIVSRPKYLFVCRRVCTAGMNADAGSSRKPHVPGLPWEDTAAPSGSWSLGQFEVHTRGIGHKLLSQMGYQTGLGLGINGQGRVDALQAQQRIKRSGLGT
jgi:G-patch domain